MIYDSNVAPGMDKRAAVECDKPGCPAAEWMPDVGSFTAANRMRMVGWEVSTELTSSEVGEGRVRGFAARCPEHIEGPKMGHEHVWGYVKELGAELCRSCGTRRAR